MKAQLVPVVVAFSMISILLIGTSALAENAVVSDSLQISVTTVKGEGKMGDDIIVNAGKSSGINVSSKLRIYCVDEDGFTKDIAYARVNQVLDNKAKATLESLLINETVKPGYLVSIESSDAKSIQHRVMVIVPEQHLARRVPDPAAETEIIRALTKDGFIVVDQTISKEIMKNEEDIAKIHNEPEKFLELLCDRTDADIIIFGEAFSQGVQPVNTTAGSAFRCGARVEIRAVYKDTGLIILADAAQSNSLDSTEELAGKRALCQTARLLMEGRSGNKGFLHTMKMRIASNKQSVQCVINGIDNENVLQKVQDAIRDSIGSDIYRNTYRAGIAKFTLGGEKSAEEYRTDISNISIKGLKLKLDNITANRIEYSIK